MSNGQFLRDWDFEQSTPNATVRVLRARSMLKGWSQPPPWKEIRRFDKAPRWNVYFAFCPDGQLTAYHHDSISRLACLPGRTGLVIASPSQTDIPAESLQSVDAIYWKGLSGFDFSAYALTLETLAQLSPGCDLFLQNDSVFGPVGDLERLIGNMRWRLSGFLASSAVENHLQSYALFFRDLQPGLVRDLQSAVSLSRSMNHWYDVVLLQETRFARIASRRHSVGSLWFDPISNRAERPLISALVGKLTGYRSRPIITFDPSLIHAEELLNKGFPFVKRSLFARNRGLSDHQSLAKNLIGRGIPSRLLEQ